MQQASFLKLFFLVNVVFSSVALLSAFGLNFLENSTNVVPYESPWKQLTTYDNRLSLQFPSSWEYSASSTLNSDSVRVHDLIFGPEITTGDGSPLYAVTISWSDYSEATDCASLAIEHMQQTLDVHNATLSVPIGKNIQAIFEPVQSIVINTYSACQFPVSTSHIQETPYRSEYYEIPWNGKLYEVRFQTADSPAEIILEPEKNNRIAHRILNSLRFSDETQSAASADNAIKAYARQKSSPSVRDFIVTEKKTFIDERGAVWMKFTVTPIPAEAADSSYGVMKQTYGKWEGRGFGTCCVEEQLPSDIAQGLGFFRQARMSNALYSAHSATFIPDGFAVEPFQGGRRFRHEQFGYTFVLPQDWAVASYATVQDFAAFDPRAASQNNQSLELIRGMKIEIEAIAKDGRTFDDYIASVKTAQPQDAAMQSLTLGGVRAWQVNSDTPTKTVSTYFDSAANIFIRVTGYFPEEDQQPVYLQTYDTIVRSVAMP